MTKQDTTKTLLRSLLKLICLTTMLTAVSA